MKQATAPPATTEQLHLRLPDTAPDQSYWLQEVSQMKKKHPEAGRDKRAHLYKNTTVGFMLLMVPT